MTHLSLLSSTWVLTWKRILHPPTHQKWIRLTSIFGWFNSVCRSSFDSMWTKFVALEGNKDTGDHRVLRLLPKLLYWCLTCSSSGSRFFHFSWRVLPFGPPVSHRPGRRPPPLHALWWATGHVRARCRWRTHIPLVFSDDLGEVATLARGVRERTSNIHAIYHRGGGDNAATDGQVTVCLSARLSVRPSVCHWSTYVCAGGHW